jgi:uncharacterized membrane protein YccC
MTTSSSQLQRFFYSHYFFGGVRQAIGVLAPPLVLIGLFNNLYGGMIAAFGAACVAIIDQPGGPRRYGTNGMLAAILLGSITVTVTGLASSNSVAIWFVVPALAFFFSMFTVFGKQGGLLGFACLLVMTLTMRMPMRPDEVLLHTTYSFLGGAFYFVFSYVSHRLMWHIEEQQTLSVALFATSDYMRARSRFYDINEDMDENYRSLIHAQAAMTEAHQAARDTVLRELPKGSGRSDRLRAESLNIFIDMVALLDSLVATHTDYATLRRRLPDSDILIFARDALRKMALNLSNIALNIARKTRVKERNSVKAELRAIEYELETFRQQGLQDSEPEIYALLIQIFRRLRNAVRLVERIADHASGAAPLQIVDERLQQSLDRFLSRQKWRLGSYTSNLRLDSSHCRYAIRVAVATGLAMTLSAALSHTQALEQVAPGLAAHSYWIVLTVLVVMKPGFAITRQRNGWRLAGTLIGCGLALVLFKITNNTDVHLAALIIASILGYALIQVNYMIAAVFNTLFVLLAFHFLSPESTSVIGERLVDTVIGCTLALLSSYILPWWEHSFMGSLAAALRRANTELFRTGMLYAELSRRKSDLHARPDTLPHDLARIDAEQHEAEMNWRVARKNMHIAFSNFASAFYRMMDEPARHQRNVSALNNLLIQNHVMASQLMSAIPVLASLDAVPPGIDGSIKAIQAYLNDEEAQAPATLETEGDLATLAYPLKQMLKAATMIRQEMKGLDRAAQAQSA